MYGMGECRMRKLLRNAFLNLKSLTISVGEIQAGDYYDNKEVIYVSVGDINTYIRVEGSNDLIGFHTGNQVRVDRPQGDM